MRKEGQVLLETVIAIFILVAMVAGIAKFVIWAIEDMKKRNEGIELTNGENLTGEDLARISDQVRGAKPNFSDIF